VFAMHQRVRRRICQAGFCLLCALPTSSLLGWAVSLKTAAHLARCETQLGERLGLAVRFKRVRYPQPGQTHYEELELAEAETGDWLLRCRALDVVRTGRKIALDPHDVQVAAERADKLLRLVIRRLGRELPGNDAIALVPTQVTLESEAGSQTYDDVSGRIELDAESSTAILRFRLPEMETGEPPQLSLIRHGTAAGVRTTILLDTLGATLPLSAFTGWFDLESVLGGEATFNGELAVQEVGGRYSCDATGVLDAVDLKRLVAERFPHHLAGSATVEIKHARLRENKLVEAAGILHSVSGTIGGSLLRVAVELLGCQPGGAPSEAPFTSGRNSAYQELSLAFSIDERGVILKNTNPAEPLLCDERGKALLFEADDAPLPLVELVRALVPESALQVPATQETVQLVRWLPLPPIKRAPDAKPDVPPLRVKQ
jgi:hypothetical protein